MREKRFYIFVSSELDR